MSRLDELKRDIEFHKRGVEISKSLLANAEKDLAALEAQERKPREFVLGISKCGQLVSAGHYGAGINFYLHGTVSEVDTYIPVIEKLPVKPLVITREMAKAFGYSTIGGLHNLVGQFKAAGIDAIPEGVK